MGVNLPVTQRKKFLFLLVSVAFALILSVVGAYLVVVSQNSASAVNGPATVYGPSPAP